MNSKNKNYPKGCGCNDMFMCDRHKPPSEDTFICAYCEQEHDLGPEEEAEKELEENFPGHSKDECAVVCTDCYEEIMAEINYKGSDK